MKIILISTDESIAGLGVRTLSSYLRQQGFDTTIVLMPTQRPDYNGFRWKDLESLCQGAELIGISCMTHGVKKAVQIKQFLEKKYTVPIVIGGMHATLTPESLINNFDLICVGEGEDVMIELACRIQKKESYNNISGLWVKTPQGLIKNNPIPLKHDLNHYPIPDYDFSRQFILRGFEIIPLQPTHINVMSEGFIVLGSRGCPHHCTYCCNKIIKERFPWTTKVRHYSVDYLINHLKEANRIFPNIKRFWIEDDTFFSKSLEEISDFSQKYKKEIGKPFYILISPWTFNQEKLKLLIDAGMNALIMGIQSGCENVNINLYHRPIKNSHILDIAKTLNSYKEILPYYDFIGMNPFEKAEDLSETIRFIRSLPSPFFIFNNNLAFYPGTELYLKALDAGINVSTRTQHSDSLIGYKLLYSENIHHKIFHFLLLQMAGKANGKNIGRIPRWMLQDKSIMFYFNFDKNLPWVSNAVVGLIAFFIFTAVSVKRGILSLFKKILGAKYYMTLKQTLRKSNQLPLTP